MAVTTHAYSLDSVQVASTLLLVVPPALSLSILLLTPPRTPNTVDHMPKPNPWTWDSTWCLWCSDCHGGSSHLVARVTFRCEEMPDRHMRIQEGATTSWHSMNILPTLITHPSSLNFDLLWPSWSLIRPSLTHHFPGSSCNKVPHIHRVCSTMLLASQC